MDQPTTLEFTIKGKIEDVKKAALAAQRRVDLDTHGFEESFYVYGDGSDFEEKMGPLTVLDDGIVQYAAQQESYGCIWEEDIQEIAQAILNVSPNVEAHISAVITSTYAEGYDLCVDIDCVDGKIDVDVTEEPYEDWEEDEYDYEDDEEDEE